MTVLYVQSGCNLFVHICIHFKAQFYVAVTAVELLGHCCKGCYGIVKSVSLLCISRQLAQMTRGPACVAVAVDTEAGKMVERIFSGRFRGLELGGTGGSLGWVEGGFISVSPVCTRFESLSPAQPRHAPEAPWTETS